MMMRKGAMELQIHYIVCCLEEKPLQNLALDLKINAMQADRSLPEFIRNMPSTSSVLLFYSEDDSSMFFRNDGKLLQGQHDVLFHNMLIIIAIPRNLLPLPNPNPLKHETHVNNI
jgi:hypothetical protein